jgi:hypothetical protein
MRAPLSQWLQGMNGQPIIPTCSYGCEPTDVIVVGGPSVLSNWGADLVRAALDSASPPTEFRAVDRTGSVDKLIATRAGSRKLCWAQFPSPDLVEIIKAARQPVVAFLDEPVDSVRFLKETSGCSFLEALRAQTAAAVVCPALLDNPSVLFVNRCKSGTTGGIGAKILEHLRIGIPVEATPSFMDQFVGEAGAAAWPLERALSRRVAGYLVPGTDSSITSEEAAVIGQVLTPMTLMAIRREVEPICWPSSVFLAGDRPNERAPLVAEVIGAARIIFYGPYFHLPAGRWQVRIVFGFSRDIFGTPFSIQVQGSSLVAKAVVKPEREGIFRGSFLMVHTRPHEPLELQISNTEGAIEGRIGLARVEFTREPA